jgi:hypothetical protein
VRSQKTLLSIPGPCDDRALHHVQLCVPIPTCLARAKPQHQCRQAHPEQNGRYSASIECLASGSVPLAGQKTCVQKTYLGWVSHNLHVCTAPAGTQTCGHSEIGCRLPTVDSCRCNSAIAMMHHSPRCAETRRLTSDQRCCLRPPPQAGCAPTDAQLNECQQNHAITKAGWVASVQIPTVGFAGLPWAWTSCPCALLIFINLPKLFRYLGRNPQFPVCTLATVHFAVPFIV